MKLHGYFILINLFIILDFNCSYFLRPKRPSNRKGVLYKSSIAPLISFGPNFAST